VSDTLRRTSEQYENTIAAREQQVTDAKTNIKTWEAEIAELKEAKAHVDSKLPKVPAKAATPANP